MLNNPTYYSQPTFRTPRKSPGRRVFIWLALLLALAELGVVVVISASANPPNAAEIRIQGLVNELDEDRLTAARHDAMSDLENLGEAAVPALMVALRSDSAALRRNAADMLGFIASPSSVASLQYTLANDPVPPVRRNAAWALGEVNSFAAIGDLQRAAIFDGNNLVRQTAKDSIARIRTRLALAAGINETQLDSWAVSPQNGDVIYATTRRDLVVSKDGGMTWNLLTQVLPGLTTQLVTSPTNAQVLYAGVDGSGIYKSTDGGRSWNAINYGLPIMPGARFVVTAITVDPTEPQRLVIATGVMLGTSDIEFNPTGLWISNNGGEDWVVMQERSSGEPITQLALKGNQLYALLGDEVQRYQFD
jgi:hypothetical protein